MNSSPRRVAEVPGDIGRGAAAQGADIESGLADVITVGSLVLANPDLVDRLKAGAPLNAPDRGTFYGGGERGYLDYPTLEFASAE